MTEAAMTEGLKWDGTRFSFRDLLVARTYEPRADAAATLVARALADRMAGVVVIRAEAESLAPQARHADRPVLLCPAAIDPALRLDPCPG